MEQSQNRIKTLRLRETPDDPSLREVYWPVEMYHLTIEMEDELRYLNPFEKLVMDFIEADGGLRSESSLAAQLCVPQDFLSCIVRRLEDKKLLDQNGNLVESSNEEKRRPVTGLAFRELVSGRFLPFVAIAADRAFAYEYPKTDGSSCLLAAKMKALPITIADVAVAFRQMQRRAQGKLYLPDIKNVRITEIHEEIALRCCLKFEGRGGEVRILNPFTDKANRFESTLEAAFDEAVTADRALGEWVLGWRRSVKAGDPAKARREKQPFETAENIWRYPQLIASLRRCAGRSFESLYAALEWALFYAQRQYAQDDSESLHAALGGDLSAASLQYVAGKLGVPSSLLENINAPSIRRFYDEEPEMLTAVALVGQAAEWNPKHPFHRLISEKFVRRMLDLKRLRDGSAHGGTTLNTADEETVLWTEHCIHMLLPSIVFSNAAAMAPADTDFEAQTALITLMGYEKFMPLSEAAKVNLQRGQALLQTFGEKGDAVDIVGCLCAALEAEFRKNIRESGFLGMSEEELFDEVEARFRRLDIEPPKSLMTTRETKLRAALQGADKTTLGGCVLAWLLSVDEKWLTAVLSGCPSLFSDIADLIDLRSHLNRQVEMRRNEIQAVFERVCNIITLLRNNAD